MAYIGRTKTPAPLTSADIPDGIVTAADLAPNSVDSSELVDGSIDTSHLSSSLTLTTPNLGTPSAVTLTNATFPTGHVLQVKYLQRTTGSSSSTSSTYADIVNMVLSITPSSTSNKILIIANPHTYIESHTADGWSAVIFGIERTITGDSPSVVYNTGGGSYAFGRNTTSDTDRQMGTQAMHYLDAPNTLSSVSYQIQYKSMHSRTIRADKDYGFSDLVLMEVTA